MQLPNPNRDGTASSKMLELSLLETNSNYLQGIYEEIGSLKKVLTSIFNISLDQLKLDKKEQAADNLADARTKAQNKENKREGRLGGALKEGAKAVGNTASGVVKNSTVGGFLSTLIGGAILLAIFAPDKAKKMMTALQDGFSELMDSKFYKKVKETAKGIFDEFNWDNLVITGILGWRIGAIYSGLKYVGSLVKKWLGIGEDGMVGGEGHPGGGTTPVKISEKDKTWIDKNFNKAFAGVGVASILMPGAVFGIVRALVGSVSGLLFGGLSTITPGMQKNIDSTGKTVKSNIMGKGGIRGASAVKGFGILGLVSAAAFLAIDFMEDGDIDNPAGPLALGVASAMATFAPAFTASLIGKFLSPAGLITLALGGMMAMVYTATKGASDALKDEIARLNAGGAGSKEMADEMFGSDARAGSRAAATKGAAVAEAQILNQAGQGTGKEAQLQGEFIKEINAYTSEGATLQNKRGMSSKTGSTLRAKLAQIGHFSGGMITALVEYAESAGLGHQYDMSYATQKIYGMISDRSGKQKFLKEANARRLALIGPGVEDAETDISKFMKRQATLPMDVDSELDFGEKFNVSGIEHAIARKNRAKWATEQAQQVLGLKGRADSMNSMETGSATIGMKVPRWKDSYSPWEPWEISNDDVMDDTLGVPEGVAKYTNKSNANKRAAQKIMNPGADQNYSHPLMGDGKTWTPPGADQNYSHPLMGDGKTWTPPGIVDSVIQSAEEAGETIATAIGNAADEVASLFTSTIFSIFGGTNEQTTNLAALVGAASASQASATNVIMMGGGPQTAPAASGSSTINNTSVQSSTNNSLYSMNEENRAVAVFQTRFGAYG